MIFALLKPLSSEYVPSGSVEQGGKEVSVHVFVCVCVCACLCVCAHVCVCVHDFIYTCKRVSSSSNLIATRSVDTLNDNNTKIELQP